LFFRDTIFAARAAKRIDEAVDAIMLHDRARRIKLAWRALYEYKFAPTLREAVAVWKPRVKFGKTTWTPETAGMMYLDGVIGLWKMITKNNDKAADPDVQGIIFDLELVLEQMYEAQPKDTLKGVRGFSPRDG
jgi:hypothetical protein